MADIVYPPDVGEYLVASNDLIAKNIPKYNLELRCITKSGGVNWSNMSATLIKDADYGLAMIENIDQRKQAEAELLKRSRELQTINNELETFSYSVSHDLMAPLRSIEGFSKILLEDYEDKLDEQGQDYLHRVCKATKDMGLLISNLLKLAKVSRSHMRQENVDLSSIALEIGRELQKRRKGYPVEFVVNPEIKVKGDKALLQIAMRNLLDNAFKFTKNAYHPQIVFGAKQDNENRVYYVSDNGVGFNMDYAKRLFVPFQRLHKAEEFPGSGVGLATVQRIVNRHGGKIWAQSAPGNATFYFTLDGGL